MTKVTANPTISADGFLAGVDQSLEHPMGLNIDDLHRWHMEDVENNKEEQAFILDHGAYIMGRNMYGPIRGEWTDDEWRGWWGDNPPYHTPVYVLTHYPHDPIEMEGGTTFYFVTEGPEAALELAKAAAGDRSVSIAGGAQTIQQYLRLGAIDEIHVAVSSHLVGAGEKLFDNIPNVSLEPVRARHSQFATHIVYKSSLKS